MNKITLFLLIGFIGAGILVTHQTIKLNTIIKNSRHSSLAIRWKGENIGYGINSPSIGNDGSIIGGVKTSAVGNKMMIIEMVINQVVVVGVTKNGETISDHSLKPGDNIVIDVQ